LYLIHFILISKTTCFIFTHGQVLSVYNKLNTKREKVILEYVYKYIVQYTPGCLYADYLICGLSMCFLVMFTTLRSTHYDRSICPSISLYTWNNSRTTGQIFIKFHTREFYEVPRHFNFHSDQETVTTTLH
jgi:hypothetical protein